MINNEERKMKSIMIIILVSVLCCFSFAQIHVKYYPTSAKLYWQYETDVTLEQPQFYMVFYCQGNDTTLFPLVEDATYEQVWDWQIGQNLYNYFYMELKPIELGRYIRLGVMAIGWNGEKSLLAVAPMITLKTYGKPILLRLK